MKNRKPASTGTVPPEATVETQTETSTSPTAEKATLFEWLAKGYRLLILLAGTGGAGKSFVARLLAEWLIAECRNHEVELKIFDADEPTKEDLARFFLDEAQIVDITSRERLVGFLHDVTASTAGGRVTLVDFRGDQQTALAATNTISPKTVEMLASRDKTRIAVVVPIVHGKPSSAAVLADWLKLFGPGAHYVIVCNQRDGAIALDSLPGVATRAIQEATPSVIQLTGLHPELARELEEKSCTMGEIAHLGTLPPSEEMAKDYGYLADVFNIGPVSDLREAFFTQLPGAFAPITKQQP